MAQRITQQIDCLQIVDMHLSFPIDSVKITIDTNANYSIDSIYTSPWIQINETDFVIDIDGVAKYRIQDGKTIYIAPYPEAYQASVQLFLNGSAFGAILHQRGILPFHGCSFKYKEKGILICGDSGAGNREREKDVGIADGVVIEVVNGTLVEAIQVEGPTAQRD